MNGIGTAFIWAAIGCGPAFLIVLGLMTARTEFIRTRMPTRTKPKR